MPENFTRSTGAGACRVPVRDVDLIRRAARTRGVTVSAFLRGLLEETLRDLRRA